MAVKEKTISPRELRKWRRGHVWLLWRFRRFYNLEEEARKAKNDGQRRHNWEKRTSTWKNILRHVKRGELFVGLKPEYMDEFEQIVLQRVKEGKNPKQILQELYEAKVKNNHHSQ